MTNLLHEQSAHIAQGVDALGAKDEGAGDQGIMFGYATNETEHLMPAPIQYAHAILRRLAEVRKDGTEPSLRPDAKSQLSVIYEDGKPVRCEFYCTVNPALPMSARLSDDIRDIVEPYIREDCHDWITGATEWWVNPTGALLLAGPMVTLVNRKKNHCRYIWWERSAWRWSFQWKRSK